MLTQACTTNPTTGRSQLVFVGEQQLQQMALTAWQETRRDTPRWNNPGQQQRLENIGLRIAAVSNLPNQSWEFVLFDKPEKNAFVLPGGKVGFYRGLMELAQRDDHIATVLGHEVGHVNGRHAAERFSQSIAAQGLAVGAQVGTTNMDPRTRNAAMAALGLGLQVGILLRYSRLQETEADRIGVDHMYNAGYDVREAVNFWQLMGQQSSGPRAPEFLSTHPDPQSRMQDLRAYINARGYAVV
jgi:predicted Zn-dependent protease